MNLEALEFDNPWLLLLALPGLALVFWVSRRRGRHRRVPALVFPSVARFKGMRTTWRQKASVLIPVFQALVVLLLVAAAARPRQGDTHTVIQSEGIAIQMVLDRSGSMEEEMKFGKRQRKRIDIVKSVFEDFISGDGDLPGRKTDLIGLTTFAKYTEESCPLVSQHEPLLTAVKNFKTVPPYLNQYDQPVRAENLPPNARRTHKLNPLNATAIGDGIRRAVLSLVTAEDDLERGEEDAGGYKIKGKVLILLTDGEDNASELDPVEAGRMARENDIRLYYILMREDKQYSVNPLTGQKSVLGMIPHDQLLDMPRQVAGSSDHAFLATDGDALRTIYEQIDELERSEIGRFEYRNYEEKYHVFLLPAFGLAFLAMFLGETFLRRIP